MGERDQLTANLAHFPQVFRAQAAQGLSWHTLSFVPVHGDEGWGLAFSSNLHDV